jgi:uncharacterized RDD family membrane protein YckC
VAQTNWYYADQGRQVGPVEETALDDLVRAGVVRDDTLVWHEGMANWQPHGAVRGVKPPAPMPAVPIGPESSYCSECGRPFPGNQLVAIGNANVCAQCKPVFLQRMREGGQAIGARRYAGFWIRLVAFIIDAIILAVVGAIINIPLALIVGVGSAGIASSGNLSGLPAIFAAQGLLVFIDLALGVAYNVYFISSRGATLGKMALGLKVIRADGGPVSVGLAFGRYFAEILSGLILYIGFIMIGFDPEKRALHDRLCETRVIYAK